MKITAGLGSVDDYPMYVEAGADECFCGYVPFAWAEKYGVLNPLNRREVRAYNVQIGSYEELKILGNMRKYYQVPVAITFNSLSYNYLDVKRLPPISIRLPRNIWRKSRHITYSLVIRPSSSENAE